MRFLTISQCCCGMENGGQRGWDDPCTPCPTKGSGKLTQHQLFSQFTRTRTIHKLNQTLTQIPVTAPQTGARCELSKCD